MKAVKRLFHRKSQSQRRSDGRSIQSPASHEEQPVVLLPVEPKDDSSPFAVHATTTKRDKSSRTKETPIPPSVEEISSKKTIVTAETTGSNYVSCTSASNVPSESDSSNHNHRIEKDISAASGRSDSKTSKNEETNDGPPIVSSSSSADPSPSAPSNASRVLAAELPNPARNDADGGGNGGEGPTADGTNLCADTDDSDDAGLLPSDRAKYKGVLKSFRGLNATEQFEEVVVPREALRKLASVSDAYDAIPLIEQTRLPRGGISMETKAVGRIQVWKGLRTGDRLWLVTCFCFNK